MDSIKEEFNTKQEILRTWHKTQYRQHLEKLPIKKQIECAVALENTKQYLARLDHKTLQVHFSGLTPDQILDIVFHIVSNQIIDEIFNSIQVLFLDSAIYHVDKVFKHPTKVPRLDEGFDEYGVVDIVVSKTRLNCRPHPVGYSFSKMTTFLNPMGDMNTFIVKAIADEHVRANQLSAVSMVKRLLHTKTTKKVVSLFDILNLSYTDPIKFNKIICNSETALLLKQHPAFIQSNSHSPLSLYKVGSIKEIDIYVERLNLLPFNYFIFYAKDEEFSERGITFATYQNLALNLDYPERMASSPICKVSDTFFHKVEDCLQSFTIVHSHNRLVNWFKTKILKKRLVLK